MYPRPDRSNIVPGQDDETTEIGWNEGLMRGGRPYRVECWAEAGTTVLTYFFSTIGLENLSDSQFADLLEQQKLLTFLGGKRTVSAMPFTDPSGNSMWSVSVVVGQADEPARVDDHVPLRPYGPARD